MACSCPVLKVVPQRPPFVPSQDKKLVLLWVAACPDPVQSTLGFTINDTNTLWSSCPRVLRTAQPTVSLCLLCPEVLVQSLLKDLRRQQAGAEQEAPAGMEGMADMMASSARQDERPAEGQAITRQGAEGQPQELLGGREAALQGDLIPIVSAVGMVWGGQEAGAAWRDAAPSRGTVSAGKRGFVVMIFICWNSCL